MAVLVSIRIFLPLRVSSAPSAKIQSFPPCVPPSPAFMQARCLSILLHTDPDNSEEWASLTLALPLPHAFSRISGRLSLRLRFGIQVRGPSLTLTRTSALLRGCRMILRGGHGTVAGRYVRLSVATPTSTTRVATRPTTRAFANLLPNTNVYMYMYNICIWRCTGFAPPQPPLPGGALMGLSAPPPHFWGGEFKKHVLEAKKILGRHYEVTKS